MTKYLVLRQGTAEGDPPGASWTNIAEVDAFSAEHAVRKLLTGNDRAIPSGGTYVAVPARSWKPVTVQTVQTTSIKLGEAT